MHSQIKKAFKNHDTACDELRGVIKQIYPIGSIIWVELGNHKITVEITGYGWNYKARPGEIEGVNVETRKRRTFYPDQIII